MPRKVLGSQHVSRMCFVCGVDNAFGVHARFLDVEGGEVVCLFTPSAQHQGYPGRLHGGLASAVLDETIGRAISLDEPGTWYVTIELKVRYRKPVPLGEELRAVGRVTSCSSRAFEAAGEILLADGTVAVEATGRYLKLPADRIVTDEFAATEWFADEAPVPESVEL